MKIIILQFMAIIAMILISCNDKENSVYLKNGSYSECATGKNLTKAQEETAYVEISAVNTNTLRVLVPCPTELRSVKNRVEYQL